jgi:hypothetical protein
VPKNLLFFLCDKLATYEKRYIRPNATLGTSPTSKLHEVAQE